MTASPSPFSIRGAARETPDRVFLVVDGEPWSFSRVAERVEARLPDPDDGPIVVLARPGVDGLLDLLAALETGRPVIPLHSRWSDAERHAFVDAVLAGPPLAADTLAVLATSGSSGQPKGVELSRQAFLASATASGRRLGWAPDGDRWLITLPLAHVGGLSILIRCLLARQTVVVPPPRPRFAAAEVADWLAAWRVTLVSWVPTQLRRMLERVEWRPPSSLRAVLLGGAAASPGLLADAWARGLDVRATYGMTEACSQVATMASPNEAGVGRPLDGVGVRIVGDHGIGPIEVRGAVLMTGYRPADSPGRGLNADGWFRTGDLGRLDADGCLHVVGRADSVIVSGGENVHPAPVEAAVAALPGVGRVCVVGVPDAEWGSAVVAWVEPIAGASLDPDAIRAELRSQLAAFRVPRRVVVVEALPSTASGKIDRRAVAKLAARSSPDASPGAKPDA